MRIKMGNEKPMYIAFLPQILESPAMNWIGSLLGAVIVAVAIKYITDVLTDRRTRKRAQAEIYGRFDMCRSQMPELFSEMKQDLLKKPTKTDFIIKNIRCCYGNFREGPFAYYMDEHRPNETYPDGNNRWMIHSNLLDNVRLLERNGFVTDVTETNVPYFRMTEEFRQLLKDM